MAPELFFDANAKTTKATDVYSHGMILWELGTRKIPFGDKNDAQFMGALFTGTKETIAADTPPGMKKVINRCWDKPEQRPVMEEVVKELNQEFFTYTPSEASISTQAPNNNSRQTPNNFGTLFTQPSVSISPVVSQTYETAKVLYDYNAQNSNELSIRAGQLLKVLDKTQGSLWYVALENQYGRGYVPYNYLQLASQNTPQHNYVHSSQPQQSIKTREGQNFFPGQQISTLTPQQPFLKDSEKVETKAKQVLNQVNPQDASLLLKWVAEGHLVEVEKLLLKNSNLVYVTETVTDRSNRTFTGITAFQYALWALDIEMCELILKYLDKVHAANQINALEEDPNRYSSHGSYYDMTLLINKTEAYLRNRQFLVPNKRPEFWTKEVGTVQRLCPAWLIYAWIEERPQSEKQSIAWATQDFVNKKVTRQYEKNRLDWWFLDGGGVGSTWAAVRANWSDSSQWRKASPTTSAYIKGVERDRINLEYLKNARTEIFKSFKRNIVGSSFQSTHSQQNVKNM
jgi:hypothetical protein